MEWHPLGVKLSPRNTLVILILLAGFLMFGWKISSAVNIVFSYDPLSSLIYSEFSSEKVLPMQLTSNSILLAQQKEVPSKRPLQDSVIINGVRLSDEKVRALEKQYRVRISPGDYWYDKICGAWGFRGGPAAGIILPFLDLGGPLQAQASNGNTGVFINGRELHVMDVVALQQITPVYRGRYWADAQGNIGLEGGPALINLWLLANSRGVRKEGILSTYDKTGVAVLGY